MIYDELLNFGSVTMTSSNPAAAGRVYFPNVLDRLGDRDEIGSGEPLVLEVRTTTAWSGACAIQFGLAAADDSAMTTNRVDLCSSHTLLVTSYGKDAGDIIYITLSPEVSSLKKRYIAAYVEAPSAFFNGPAGVVTAKLIPYNSATLFPPHLYISKF